MSSEDFKRKLELIKSHIKSYPDFPKPGILFRDIFSVFLHPEAATALQDIIIEHVNNIKTDIHCVVGLESRGFLLGPSIAHHLKVPFVPIRKKGKLPGKVDSVDYGLEYGKDKFEIQRDSVTKGQNILIIDDLLATGGSMEAACKLLTQLGVEITECLVIMELANLNGREKVNAPIYSFIQY